MKILTFKKSSNFGSFQSLWYSEVQQDTQLNLWVRAVFFLWHYLFHQKFNNTSKTFSTPSQGISLHPWYSNNAIIKYFLREGKYLLKRVFVSVLLLLLLLCLKMLIFVLFYINPCVFTWTRDSWKFVALYEVVWNISFVCCSVHHCDAWEIFQDHRSI